MEFRAWNQSEHIVLLVPSYVWAILSSTGWLYDKQISCDSFLSFDNIEHSNTIGQNVYIDLTDYQLLFIKLS